MHIIYCSFTEIYKNIFLRYYLIKNNCWQCFSVAIRVIYFDPFFYLLFDVYKFYRSSKGIHKEYKVQFCLLTEIVDWEFLNCIVSLTELMFSIRCCINTNLCFMYRNEQNNYVFPSIHIQHSECLKSIS